MIDFKTAIFIPAKIIESVLTIQLKGQTFVAVFTKDGDKYAVHCPNRYISEKLESEISKELKYCRTIVLNGNITIKGKTGEEWKLDEK